MNPKIDETNLKAFDELILQLVRDLKTEDPDKAGEITRVVLSGLGEIKVTVDGSRKICCLVYRNPAVPPLELFTIEAEPIGELDQGDKKQINIYRISKVN